MTHAPSQRRQAAAGVTPSRRPAAALLTTALLTLTACAAQHQAPGNVFAQRQQVSLPQLTQAIDNLYRSHPSLVTFTTEDVQYTDAARKTVLRKCTTTQSGESTQLTACAPYIFFLYEYGRQAPAPDAVNAAGDLYWYAATHITGPADAKASLSELLRSWDLPVPAPSSQETKKALTAAIITEATDTILAQKSVRLTITGTSTSAVAERIQAEVGTTAGEESIEAGHADAQIRITKPSAYLTGTQAGLTTLLGLPQAVAAKADNRWIAISAGTREYQDLATEDTIAALPASLLPTQSDAVKLTTGTVAGRKVYILTWIATGYNDTKITARLILDATSHALPVSETTASNGYRQTVTLTAWNKPFTVRRPRAPVPYQQIANP